MKKLLAALSSISVFFSASAAAHELNRGVEARFALFFPQSSTYRHLYGTVNPAFALEAFGKIKGPFMGWTNLEWLPGSGNSIGGHDATHINILNWGFGAKYAYRIKEKYTPYIGIGPNISTVWIHNHSHLHKRQSKTGIGFVIKSGFYWEFHSRFYCDFFADYLYQYVQFRKNANVGGFHIGAGLGVKY